MNSFFPVTAEDYAECLRHPAEIIETGLGPVEYASRGEGPVLLAVHGGGAGGFDSGLIMCECFRKNGFRVVSPSRPGYLGTPLESGATFEEQADLLAALLDSLGLDSVAVVGASAGGPPSYLLAQRHPGRVRALVEIDSCCVRYTKGREITRLQEALYLSKPGLWLIDLLARLFPAAMVKNFLKTESTLGKEEVRARVGQVVNDPGKLAFIRAFTKVYADYTPRKAGTGNDLARMAEIGRLPMERISCPALIIQGDADSDVTPDHSEYAHASIKGSELRLIPRGSHIGFWISPEAETVQKEAVEWLKSGA